MSRDQQIPLAAGEHLGRLLGAGRPVDVAEHAEQLDEQCRSDLVVFDDEDARWSDVRHLITALRLPARVIMSRMRARPELASRSRSEDCDTRRPRRSSGHAGSIGRGVHHPRRRDRDGDVGARPRPGRPGERRRATCRLLRPARRRSARRPDPRPGVDLRLGGDGRRPRRARATSTARARCWTRFRTSSAPTARSSPPTTSPSGEGAGPLRAGQPGVGRARRARMARAHLLRPPRPPDRRSRRLAARAPRGRSRARPASASSSAGRTSPGSRRSTTSRRAGSSPGSPRRSPAAPADPATGRRASRASTGSRRARRSALLARSAEAVRRIDRAIDTELFVREGAPRAPAPGPRRRRPRRWTCRRSACSGCSAGAGAPTRAAVERHADATHGGQRAAASTGRARRARPSTATARSRTRGVRTSCGWRAR